MARLGLTLVALLAATACRGPEWRAEAPPGEVEGLRSAEPVAFTPDDDLTPSVSADGRYVAYVSQQNGGLSIWLRDYGSNSNYPLATSSTDDFDPAISPRGDWVAFASRRADAKGDLYLTRGLGARSGEARLERLTDDATQDRQPIFSADGQRLYFTAAVGIGAEFIAELDLATRRMKRVSATPGFDPAPAPDGEHLVYTAPAGQGGRPHPHLVALRLADGATRAVTLGDSPAGFARFVPARATEGAAPATLVFVRFPDDDDGDGVPGVGDHASLWRLEVDLGGLFSGRAEAVGRPFPLTDGSGDELFPEPGGDGFLYFTQGSKQQDISRLPLSGTFPVYEEPRQYFALAQTIQDPRTRWFALRCAEARAEPGSLVHGQALLRIGNLHLEQGRPDLARRPFAELAASSSAADPALVEIGGIARTELASIHRKQALGRASTPLGRERVLAGARLELEALAEAFAGSPRVAARVDLELAELFLDRGERARAIETLERVVTAHGQQEFSAARAMLRRIELLGIAHDPGALGAAYAEVFRRFPGQREVVREAAQRIVAIHLADLRPSNDWRELVDALRRLVPRYGSSPVRVAARSRLVALLLEHGELDAAAAELERLVAEAAGDRLTSARAIEELATVNERRGALEEALAGWAQLRSAHGDVPGVGARAREAITRVNLQRADADERRGALDAARAAYREVIENDLSQVQAHRRYLALSAATGRLEEALGEARSRARRSASTPIARYAHGLALTWTSPPALDAALEEIEEAIRLNPQFTHAYITRGWIREMKELERPSLFERMKSTLREKVGDAIGGILEVEIEKTGLLEQAIEDYKTALRLNPESLAPEVEAEILLNLGNGHYRLADATNDLSNMRVAFERYFEALGFGRPFPSPAAEAVFWERLGRAAFWVDEHAISVMATRRAIATAEASGLESRLPQLYGNLALAYDQAGEDAYARAALDRFQALLEDGQRAGRLVIALRDRARARLGAAGRHRARTLDAVLAELKSARQRLDEAGEPERGQLPSAWLAGNADSSRAQFGFDRRSELDLNLGLAELAHEALGDSSRARALRDRRFELTREIMENIPSVLWVMKREPIALVLLRQRLGLAVAEARERFAEGRLAEAEARLEAIGVELERWLGDKEQAKNAGLLAQDRGRFVAARLEMAAAARARGSSDFAATLEAAEEDVRGAIAMIEEAAGLEARSATVGAARMSDPRLEALPLALTSSAAIAETSSAALSRPRLAPFLTDARGVRARLRHARALVRLAGAHGPASAPAGSLAALLARLDRRTDQLARARSDFEAAARDAAGAGPELGPRLLGLSLLGVAETSRHLGDRPPASLAALRREAEALFRAAGALELAEAAALEAALTGGEAELAAGRARIERTLPALLAPNLASVERLLARTASAALGRGALAEALAALDRRSLLRLASGPVVELSAAASVKDAEVSSQLRQLLSALRDARRELGEVDHQTTIEVHALRLERVRAAVEALGAAVEAGRDRVSERAAARLFAQPQPVEDIAESLGEDEALLVIAELDGRLELFFLETTEDGEHPIHHHATGRPVAEVVAELEAVRAALRENRAPDPARVAKLQELLLAPFLERLVKREVLVVAQDILGGPIPKVLIPEAGPALAQVAAPSLLELARRAQVVAASGTVLLGGPALDDDDALVLSPEEARTFRSGAPPAAAGASRRLDRRAAVELLGRRPRELVLVEAPLRLEPGALERSVIELAAERSGRPGRLDRQADAFHDELPLGALTIPARALVLARVTERPVGLGPEVPAAALMGLEAVTALGGVATVVAIPERVPQAAARRVVAAFRRELQTLGPAQALERAVYAELPANPAVALIALLGAPGLDAAGTKAYAGSKLGSARVQATGAIGRQDHAAAVPALDRWIRLQLESGQDAAVEIAYGALIGLLLQHVSPPDFAGAADRQEELLEFLGRKGAPPAKLGAATVDLASLYGDADDAEKAGSTFEAGIARLKEAGDRLGLARGLFLRGKHERSQLDFAAAARSMEEAVALYEAAGAYTRKDRPAEAGQVLGQVAELYLNALSDPVRAQTAYERVLSHAQTREERVQVLIGLARVARRRGDFAAASAYAARAQREASEDQAADLELGAVIEAANIAWYQGDYRLGEELCQRSLTMADALLASLAQEAGAAKKPPGRRITKRVVERNRIFALSVCGLVAMSQRDFEGAVRHLERARRQASRLGDEREVAAQLNNLGRVYLEFDRLQPAIEAFRGARAIDERLQDRYGLAYDLRNLGRALTLVGQHGEADAALRQALLYAIEVKDTNNELRARFSLAELERARGRLGPAEEAYRAAQPLAHRLDVKELAWQIHRALGLMARARGAWAEAEAELRHAVRIVRSITGRAAASDGDAHRYAAFDDLMLLLLDQDRAEEAYEIATLARSLEQAELLEDSRIAFASPEVPGLLRAVREATTATAAAPLAARLGEVEPRLFALLRPVSVAELARRLPEDAAVVMYRVTAERVVSFVIDRDGLFVGRAEVDHGALRALVGRYGERMMKRAELNREQARLAELLVAPIRERVAGKARLVLLPHQVLRYVAFPALPFDAPGEALVDRFVLLQALHLEGAVTALARPLGGLEGRSILAQGAPAQPPRATDRPLPFAQKELELIREEYPSAEISMGERVTRASVLEGLTRANGVFHFAGHAFLAGDDARARFSDPLGGQLRTSDGGVSMAAILGRRIEAELVVLSACSSLISPGADRSAPSSGDEVLSLAQSIHLAGAGHVLATTLHVSDVAASLVMKRFYRAARRQPAAEALREAQRAVRAHYPHPAWWAAFSLSAGGW